MTNQDRPDSAGGLSDVECDEIKAMPESELDKLLGNAGIDFGKFSSRLDRDIEIAKLIGERDAYLHGIEATLQFYDVRSRKKVDRTELLINLGNLLKYAPHREAARRLSTASHSEEAGRLADKLEEYQYPATGQNRCDAVLDSAITFLRSLQSQPAPGASESLTEFPSGVQ